MGAELLGVRTRGQERAMQRDLATGARQKDTAEATGKYHCEISTLVWPVKFLRRYRCRGKEMAGGREAADAYMSLPPSDKSECRLGGS